MLPRGNHAAHRSRGAWVYAHALSCTPETSSSLQKPPCLSARLPGAVMGREQSRRASGRSGLLAPLRCEGAQCSQPSCLLTSFPCILAAVPSHLCHALCKELCSTRGCGDRVGLGPVLHCRLRAQKLPITNFNGRNLGKYGPFHLLCINLSDYLKIQVEILQLLIISLHD